MRVDELQRVLHEQADAVHDDAVVARGHQVHDRIRDARRRRTTGIAALAVVAVAAAGGAAVTLRAGHDPGIATHHKQAVFESNIAGRTLLNGEVAPQGQATLDIAADPTSDDLFFSLQCNGVGKPFWFHTKVNGKPFVGGDCTAGTPTSYGEDGFWRSSRTSDYSEFGLTGGGGHVVVHMWVTRGEHGHLVKDPRMQLAAGVYQMPPVVDHVGDEKIYRLTRFENRDWTMVSLGTSDPGQRRYTSSMTDATGRWIATVYATGTGDQPGRIQIAIDGEPRSSIMPGGTQSFALPAGSTGHTVTVQVSGNARPDQQVGIAFSKLVD